MTTLIAVNGPRNSGKTTWVCALLGELERRGVSASTIKRTHHDCLPPGKDSSRHLQSGAQKVLLVSPAGSTVYQAWASEPSLEDLVRTHFPSHDLVLVEGYRGARLARFIVGVDPEANTDDVLAHLPKTTGDVESEVLQHAVDLILQRLNQHKHPQLEPIR